MHGVPPKDFPEKEIIELFKLHAQIERMPPEANLHLRKRHDALDKKVRTWPRTKENDPYWDASHELAGHLEQELGWQVHVGFNEFCAPSLQEAPEDAAASKPADIMIVTPMMIRGGEHSEVDIPMQSLLPKASIQKSISHMLGFSI